MADPLQVLQVEAVAVTVAARLEDDDKPVAFASHSVSRAVYPIPQRVSQALTLLSLNNKQQQEDTASDVDVDVHHVPLKQLVVDDPTTAMTHLVENALSAMDLLYFATAPQIRQDDCWQKHRTCLRVQGDVENGTLTITDLGIGMTRADLINMLGVGRSNNDTTTGNNNNMSRSAPSSVASSDDDDDDDDVSDNDEEDDEEAAPAPKPTESTVLHCQKNDLGGFYAALCALGVGVRVGTKSKFDDYYEFQVGIIKDDETTVSPSSLQEFVIQRPMAEGAVPSVETGFTNLTQVRGDSGTMVQIQLQPQHLHILEESILLPLLTKIMETSQYTFALASATSPEEQQAIIQASAIEQARIPKLLLKQEQPSQSYLQEEGIGMDNETTMTAPSPTPSTHNSVFERSKYIPLRLSLSERKMLRLVEASMNCCDYTSQVDVPGVGLGRNKRTHAQLKGITSVLRGLVTACDYAAGQKLATGDSEFSQYQPFLCQMLEIARRHKIMNPEKMRTEYGQLVYLLQDAVQQAEHLGFSVQSPIETVYKFLQERGGLALLSDKWVETATEEILADKKTRSQIQTEIQRKERAVSSLKSKYASSQLRSEEIHLCLYSICDNNSFLNSNRVPIDKIIQFLSKHFSPTEIPKGYSLSIVSGQEGARLSHNHERQYSFALQSLTLWRDIIDDMFRLWAMAEQDLLSESVGYSLQDTGQGMQRVQQSPRTYKAMQQILVRVQGKVQQWVGSSVIHLGDHNVPNALSFIDKYTQVPRILGPIVACLENLEKLCEKDAGIQDMIDEGFGGLEKLRMDILYDFFRSAFDGSGADNFYDAGSCIDGRLTSAWNWCEKLPQKSFYPIFKLTGFIGFDGEFK